ncbi:Nonsense-mediated mRNA decay protein 2 [Wickerhamomyces ciferrii]|uniref:Nonsense-mediated mRNA decay protein 2 n=1 Tax=Wickerhamomyces ciferrii (strain ATCC 14091 / BCRC 22168 / CBS 111 / JCM 3599 / NBRC 0793 / NRRL Y-1031 F-60-10) TaxID=1206466 RepID=K0KAX3_WICCF|nr:Nonsense-mediated mRNA decay protein 2 [Wickerhamomyces ciferrii]CCH42150.1 Nonsense-mediated mRNA decay protein 2 [Wickerhamomyces ciferrii]
MGSLNLSAWDNELQDGNSKLDTSLKKNNAFIKKLKTSINKDNQDSVLKDIKTLSLTKYLSEIIISSQEGLLKCTKSIDVPSAIEIISALHQRFNKEFTPHLFGWMFLQIQVPKTELDEKDEKERISKVKLIIRFLVEFESVGLFNGFKNVEPLPQFMSQRAARNEGLIPAVLKESLSYKMKVGLTVSIATTFIKRFPKLLETNEELHILLNSYSEIIISRTKDLHNIVKNLKTKNHKAQVRTGRIVEEIEADLSKAIELFERFKTATDILCPFFEIEPPSFTDDDNNDKSNENESVIVNKDSGIWANEEDRKFYQVLPEIPSEVIDSALNSSNDSSKANEMNEFLVHLETASNLKDIDDATLEFWNQGLIGKASKNRLLKHFTTTKDIGRVRVYARFLKSSDPHLGNLKDELLEYLDRGFRSQIYHNGLNFKNIMFFCEMIKFGLVPEHVIFHKIRSLILNLTTPNNIEILSIFFEISGKYLLSEHNKLMEEMLDLLQAKRKNDKLTINNKMAISNLFLVLKPPSIKSIQNKSKVLKPEQAFLKTLVRSELKHGTLKQVSSIIRSADLNDSDIMDTMSSLFTKPEKINYENITLLSDILKNLRRDFKIHVVDTILEGIIRGLEINDYRYNRIRMAHVKYISEICERKIINVSLIHDLLYKILTFGHAFNNPMPGRESELDPLDDYFRIHLVCSILQNFTLRSKKFEDKFQLFLTYFDYYIFLKDSPLPKDCEFKVVNAFEKYKFKRSSDLKTAIETLNEIVKSKGIAPGTSGDDDEDDEEDEDEEDENDEDDDDDDDEDDDDEEDEDEDGPIDDELKNRNTLNIDGQTTGDEEDDENIKLSYEMYERKLQEEEERKIEEALEREFKKMVFDSMSSHKIDKTTLELPQNIKSNRTEDFFESNENNSKPNNSSGKIPFTLVTKKGKSIATKNFELPSNVKFANNVVEEEKRRRSQKEQINKYILQSKFDDENE